MRIVEGPPFHSDLMEEYNVKNIQEKMQLLRLSQKMCFWQLYPCVKMTHVL